MRSGHWQHYFPLPTRSGAVPIFYSLTATDSRPERRQQAQRTTIAVILILTVFLVSGRTILQFFGISLDVLRIAGGLLVGHAAWELVASKPRLMDAEQKAGVEKEDVSFTPMATPLVAGPGSIGVIIGISTRMTEWSDYLGCAIGIGLFGALLYICPILGESLLSLLGRNGMGALNRILEFFILAIAVQLIADGVLSLLHTAAPNLFR
jgi:multiple antibiotic resistance protein